MKELESITPGGLIIFSGPHGSGKDTLLNIIIQHADTREKLVRFTTRQQSRNEINGKDYRFICRSTFDAIVSKQGFLEYASYADGSSGTSKRELNRIVLSGKIACCSLNYDDATYLKTKSLAAGVRTLQLFISPVEICDAEHNPDFYLSALANRMIRRGRDTDDIPQRLAVAEDYLRKFIKTGMQENIVYIFNGRDNIAQAVYETECAISDFFCDSR